MGDKVMINIVATRCPPDEEAKFNKWYDEVHVPMLFKFKGMRKAIRCQITNETEEYPKYLAIYEFENKKSFEEYETSPELDAVRKEMSETWKDRRWETVWRVQYEITKTWER